jgi:hypothetical protein
MRIDWNRSVVVLLFAALACPGFSAAQEDWTIPAAALRSLSGEEAKKHVIEVSRYYREDASPGFHEAALYIRNQARQLGLAGVEIESFASDGVIRHFNKRTRYAWHPRSAELWLLHPKRKLADFQDASTHLAGWSQRAHVSAEVVDIGAGKPEDYSSKDVRGKIVFTSAPPFAVQHEAVTERGAVGIISYWSSPARSQFPDEVNWLDTANNTPGEIKTFGFVLSKRQGISLKERLARGPLLVHALVDAELGSGQLEVVHARIPGSDPQSGEIILIAHICHFNPSSNDDASGVGLLLEIARTWKMLIASGQIRQSRRTIHLMWVPENYGTVAYLAAHPEVSKTVKAAIDLDMVGEDEDKCNSVFRVIRTPDSRPSFLPDVVEHFTELVAAQALSAPEGSRSVFRYSFDQYSGGSDHVWFNDAGVGVPAVLLNHWPDNFYHTNQDAPDKVDPTELLRVGLITFSSAKYIADADRQAVYSLAQRVAIRGERRIAAEMESAMNAYSAENRTNMDNSIRTRLFWLVERETHAISSTEMLDEIPSTDVRNLAERFRSQEERRVHDFLSALGVTAPLIESEPALSAVYVRRGRFLSQLWEQSLQDVKLEPEEEKQALAFVKSLPYGSESAAELFNLVDGRKSLEEICKIVESERMDEFMFDEYFGDGSMAAPPAYPSIPIDRKKLLEFVRLSEKAGLVTVKEQELSRSP